MKTTRPGGLWLAAGLALAAVTTRVKAEEDFSTRLTAEEFASAGLGKLTPAELARLNALIQAQRSGELAKERVADEARMRAAAEKVRIETEAKIRAETEAKVRAETEARVRAEVAAKPPAGTNAPERASLLGRMRVLLTPGTDIEFARVETQLVGPFRGYEPGKVLALSNGQQWRVIDGSFWAPAKDANKPRRVVIEPGVFGSFFLSIEDGGRPKVKFVGNTN